MSIDSIISMLGGLALFLYGMNFLGEKLEKMSGGKLEYILEKMTDKTYKAVLLGIAVTGVIQSSSAVTVMVVGFVNSGIMKLSRAISVIMGANVGTTVTAWILSLTGISGDSFIMNMLKPSFFAPILAIVGVFILMFSKKEKTKNIAGAITGFSVLMMGMTFMSNSMSSLADNEQFTSIFVKFSNPLLGILVGAVLTAVIQSSSASVGILQALALSGTVTYSVAFPIILGQNIGTCITALISSLGTSKNAKRAAFAHLYFNVIGVIVSLVLFYGANAIFDFSFLNNAANPADIAIMHTAFNVFATVILLPFTKQLEMLATKTIKDSKEDREDGFKIKELIDDKFFINPAYAVEKCRLVTNQMADIVEKTAMCALSSIKNYSKEKEKLVKKNEKLADEYEEALETYLVKLNSFDLTDELSKEIFMLHHQIENLEKISDYSEDILKAKSLIHEKNYSISDKAKYELNVMIAALTKTINLTIVLLKNKDFSKVNDIKALQSVAHNLKKELKNRHLQRIENGECSIKIGFLYSDIINSLERIADHCFDIAISMMELENGDYKIHSYIKEIKNSDEEFIKNLDKHLEKYSLN